MSCCDDDNFPPVPDAITVENDGVVIGSFDTVNFVGDVLVTDAGGGKADITIPGTKQVFRYVATGAELATFSVALPAARASADYNVQITMGGPTVNPFFGGSPRALIATFTVNGFDVEVPVAPTAGDIYMITVEDLT
jgi:hypothetical protein